MKYLLFCILIICAVGCKEREPTFTEQRLKFIPAMMKKIGQDRRKIVELEDKIEELQGWVDRSVEPTSTIRGRK